MKKLLVVLLSIFLTVSASACTHGQKANTAKKQTIVKVEGDKVVINGKAESLKDVIFSNGTPSDIKKGAETYVYKVKGKTYVLVYKGYHETPVKGGTDVFGKVEKATDDEITLDGGHTFPVVPGIKVQNVQDLSKARTYSPSLLPKGTIVNMFVKAGKVLAIVRY